MLTNGSYLKDGPLRQFELIAETVINGVAYSWVKPINGWYTNEGPLTFKSEDLKSC